MGSTTVICFTGKLEMISVRNGPHFTVYDALTDQGVPCHIPTEKLAEAMDAFGKVVLGLDSLLLAPRQSGAGAFGGDGGPPSRDKAAAGDRRGSAHDRHSATVSGQVGSDLDTMS